jgi:copper(I)-binding protein
MAADLRQLAHALPTTPQVVNAWARTAEVGDTSAVYLRMQNPSAQVDRLLSVASPIANAEVHQSMTATCCACAPRMRSSYRPGAEVRLEPGGLHIMLTDLQQPPVAGGEISLNFTFERAGTIEVQVPVRASDPTP